MVEKLGDGNERGQVENDVNICDVIKVTEKYLAYQFQFLFFK